MKAKRLTTLLLALLMAGSTLVACGNNTDSPEETTSSVSTSSDAEGESELKDALPEGLNYGNQEIVFISGDQLTAEELTNDPVSDIIYERNKLVESRLNVEINCIQEGDAVGKIITSINGGSADYDILVDFCWTTAPRFAEGYFADLRKTQYLDFDKPWWNQSFNDVVSYNNAQYAVTGDMTLSLYRRAYATVFNKKLFTDAGQTFLYDFVEDGTWTLDKQTAMIPLFHKDNGNATQDTSGDIYGLVTNDFIYVDPYWAACEVDIIKKNNDGEYEWAFESEKMYEMADKVLALFYATDGGTYVETDDFAAEDTVNKMFSSGYAAMATLCIEHLEDVQMRQMGDEYGVVPMPKYEESQATYNSQMHDGFQIISIPTTVIGERLDMTSAVLEAMASTSYKLVRPVYYETTLRTKLAQDPQSAEMMDLVINNIRIDVGFVYSHAISSNGRGFHQNFQDLIASKTNDTVSRFKTTSKSAKNLWAKFLSKLDQLGTAE